MLASCFLETKGNKPIISPSFKGAVVRLNNNLTSFTTFGMFNPQVANIVE